METAILPTELVYLSNFKEDKQLVSQIMELTRPSYVSINSIIDREIRHNKDIYIIRSTDSKKLYSFFMVNYELVNGEGTYYLGLSACDDSYKGRGLVKQLYLQFMDDCRVKERILGRKILLWWTTATPVVYYWFNKHAQDVQPTMHGGYNSQGKAIALQIIAEKFPTIIPDSQHPFILRSVATETNYSERERNRIHEVSENLDLDIFQKFNVVEERGDRFLMLGYAPDF